MGSEHTHHNHVGGHGAGKHAGGRILVALVMNLLFCIMELIGGLLTNSSAIISDALHSFGDALSTGVSWLLERKSTGKANADYTYGYARYSLLGALITTTILFIGAALLILEAVERILEPEEVDSMGMIVIACLGALFNFIAAWVTHRGESLNQKSVSLHMLEDTLSWLAILAGAVVMRLTGFELLDPLLSIGVAVFIFISAIKPARKILEVFLEKTPKDVDIVRLRKAVLAVPGVVEIHHLHVRSLDGERNLATAHIVVERYSAKVKMGVKEALAAQGVEHSTVELELANEDCGEEKHRA